MEKKSKAKENISEIKKVVVALNEICKEYKVTAEIMANTRGKSNPTHEEEMEGDIYVTDPAKFKAKNVGYIAILKGKISPEKYEELETKIFDSELKIARIWLDFSD